MSENQTNNDESHDVGNYDEDMKKYTKIDNLDEDDVVDSGRYFLVSFISPEGVMNCNMRGLKIRTYKNRVTFGSLDDAKKAADEINKKDKYFNVFVGETGKWMGWDPSPDDKNFVEEEQWANKDQNLIMQKMKEKEAQQQHNLDELNALVGKKKDIIDKDGKAHKKRVAKAIKDGINAKSENMEVVNEETVNNEMMNNARKVKNNPALIKEKLRKKLQEKKEKEEKKDLENKTVLESVGNDVKEASEEKTELDANIKKLTELLEKSKQ